MTASLPPLVRPVPEQFGSMATELLAALDAAHVPCWVDSGALLGLVRDGALPTWDKDIDLGVWDADVGVAQAIARGVASRHGANFLVKQLDGRPYALLLTPDRPTAGAMPIALHVFERSGRHATSPQPHFLLGAQARYAKHVLSGAHGVRGRLRAIRARPAYAVCTAISTLRLGRPLSAAIKLRDRVAAHDHVVGVHPAERVGTRWCYRIFMWTSPLRHFTTLDELAVGDWTLRMPSDVEGYLTHRYGAAWRTPQRAWFYVFDDRSLKGVEGPLTRADGATG